MTRVLLTSAGKKGARCAKDAQNDSNVQGTCQSHGEPISAESAQQQHNHSTTTAQLQHGTQTRVESA